MTTRNELYELNSSNMGRRPQVRHQQPEIGEIMVGAANGPDKSNVPPTQVDAQVLNLEDVIEELGRFANSLDNKLQPVLLPAFEGDGAEENNPLGPASPLEKKLNTLFLLATTTLVRLRGIEARITV